MSGATLRRRSFSRKRARNTCATIPPRPSRSSASSPRASRLLPSSTVTGGSIPRSTRSGCACRNAPGLAEGRGSKSSDALRGPNRRDLRVLRLVQRNRGPDERLEGILIDALALADVDGPAHLALEARVEEAGGIVERCALEERELDDALVGLPGADAAAVRPDGRPAARGLHPLPLLDHVGVGLLDQGAQPGEGLAAPVAELLDPRVDLLSGGLLLAGHHARP